MTTLWEKNNVARRCIHTTTYNGGLVLGRIGAILAVVCLLLSGCSNGKNIFQNIGGLISSGGSNTYGIITPSAGQWINYAAMASTVVGSSFQIDTNPIPGYVYTAPPGGFRQGATVTLNYTVTGNPNYVAHDPADTLPASVTLFAWQKNDNVSCDSAHVSYRMWNGTRGSLTPGNHTLSAVIDGNTWTNCYGKTDPQGFANLLNNLLGVGFTFGGANFYGHGITSTPSVTFTINSFTVQ